MIKPELDDDLWTLVEPLIPVKARRVTHPGRLPRDARACLNSVLFVLFTGIPWEYLPREFGCCGMTCWRRLCDWQAAGVWDANVPDVTQLLLLVDAIPPVGGRPGRRVFVPMRCKVMPATARCVNASICGCAALNRSSATPLPCIASDWESHAEWLNAR